MKQFQIKVKLFYLSKIPWVLLQNHGLCDADVKKKETMNHRGNVNFFPHVISRHPERCAGATSTFELEISDNNFITINGFDI